jgi:hypothetical protein
MSWRPLALILTLALSAVTARGADEPSSVDKDLAEALRSMPSPFGLQALKELVARSTSPQKMEIISVLEHQRRADARPVLDELTMSGDPFVAQSAVMALKTIGAGSKEDRDAIGSALANNDERVRRAAIACIVSWHDLTFVPELAAHLKGVSPVVHDEIVTALGGLTGQGFGDDADAWTSWYRDHEQATRERFTKVADRLQSEDPKVVVSAIADLSADIEHRVEVVVLLKPLVKDSDDRVAAAAISALRAIAPGELAGVEDVKAPSEPVRPVALPKKAPPPQPSGGSPFVVIVLGIAVIGAGAWWVRRLIAGTRGPSVAEVVARAQREAGIGSERDVPAVRPARPAPTVAGVTPAAPKPAAKSTTAMKGAPKPAADVTIGKRGEKIFKLD